MNNSFWTALFNLLGKTVEFASGLLSTRKKVPPSEPIDAEAARAGTAAGAAANEASHIQGSTNQHVTRN